MKKSVLQYKAGDWVSVQPLKKGKPDGPRVNGIISRVHRKGYHVKHVPGRVHGDFHGNESSIVKCFDFDSVKDAIPFVFTDTKTSTERSVSVAA
jgi:hypothetical protein